MKDLRNKKIDKKIIRVIVPIGIKDENNKY